MILLKNINKTSLTGNELKRYRRKKRILKLLYNNESLSGPVICKKIGVSLPTALVMINELIEAKFLEVRGTGESRGGRKPAIYGLSNHSIFIVACELGRYIGKLAIFNSHNEAVGETIQFETSINDNKLVDKIYSATQELIQKDNIDIERIFAVGLTMPGLVDENSGINHTIKDQKYRNIGERLEGKFNKLVYVNNDARMQAFGEYKFGEAKGHENAVIVNWNWGIGIGMILDGKLYNGSTGFAGELSHAKFIEKGELCICGKRGCLETVTSVSALLNGAIEGIKNGKVSQLTGKFKGREQELKPEDILKAAKSGDEFSISLLNNLGLALGEGLSTTIQLLNPDIIVLGGTIALANQYVLTPIQMSINKNCLEQISANTKIVISKNWEHSGFLGIAAVLFQKIFSDMYN